jgi:hypothetical protein
MRESSVTEADISSDAEALTAAIWSKLAAPA